MGQQRGIVNTSMSAKLLAMGTVAEIEDAIQKLPHKDAWKIAKWLQEYLDEQWDKQIEKDVRSGKLDKLIAKARSDFKAGRSKPLNEVLDES